METSQMIPKLKEPLVAFDIDDTLVSWEAYGQFKEGMVEFEDPATGGSLWLEVIWEHVEAIKSHHVRGHTIVLWSAGGADWAEEVAKKLGIRKYVHAFMSKPNWYYDDIPSSEFLPEFNRKHYRLKKRDTNNE